jgi:transcriptional regulator with XRE-family HTH domain
MGKPIDPRPGQRLHQVRQHRGMSQGRIARLIGVSTGTVQGYEHGRTHLTVDRLVDLARALQCEPAELLAPPGSPLPRYRRSTASRAGTS